MIQRYCFFVDLTNEVVVGHDRVKKREKKGTNWVGTEKRNTEKGGIGLDGR